MRHLLCCFMGQLCIGCLGSGLITHMQESCRKSLDLRETGIDRERGSPVQEEEMR